MKQPLLFLSTFVLAVTILPTTTDATILQQCRAEAGTPEAGNQPVDETNYTKLSTGVIEEIDLILTDVIDDIPTPEITAGSLTRGNLIRNLLAKIAEVLQDVRNALQAIVECLVDLITPDPLDIIPAPLGLDDRNYSTVVAPFRATTELRVRMNRLKRFTDILSFVPEIPTTICKGIPNIGEEICEIPVTILKLSVDSVVFGVSFITNRWEKQLFEDDLYNEAVKFQYDNATYLNVLRLAGERIGSQDDDDNDGNDDNDDDDNDDDNDDNDDDNDDDDDQDDDDDDDDDDSSSSSKFTKSSSASKSSSGKKGSSGSKSSSGKKSSSGSKSSSGKGSGKGSASGSASSSGSSMSSSEMVSGRRRHRMALRM